VQALVVVPVDPLEGRKLDVGEGAPGSFAVDLLGLVEADGRFGEGVVIAVADRPDRREHPMVVEDLRERVAGVLGGFARSLQHLLMRGCGGQAGWMDEGVDGAFADEVAWGAVASAGGRALVLA
jgi:hypothetical protein